MNNAPHAVSPVAAPSAAAPPVAAPPVAAPSAVAPPVAAPSAVARRGDATSRLRRPEPLQPAELGTILAIWAHPDDETYLAGGVMAAARDAGNRVVCATATAGELGTDDPATWPPARLARLRRWEAAAAMAALGVDEHVVRGFPDGGLAALDGAGRDWVAGLIDAVRPDTILTFGPDGITFHPDHVAVHRWVTAAWTTARRPGRLLYATATCEHLAAYGELYERWGMYMSDDRPTGVPEAELTVHLRLSGAPLDRKLVALRALATQTAGVMALLGPGVYEAQVAEEAFVDAR